MGYPAHTGNPDAFIIVNFDSGSGTATLNNWLLTPPLVLQNGDSMTFWTRTVDPVEFPDRLQVRLSINGPSTNVGTTATQVGDFTTLLLDINPTYQIGGAGSYPTVWTQYSVVVTGVPSPVAARFAFRYFVEFGGPDGNNSDGIGIDTVTVNSCNAPPGVSGTVTYANAIGAPTPRFVSNVVLMGTGSSTVTGTTDFPGGNYSLRGFGFGSYTVTPSKTGGLNGAINSFDAGRIAQHVAGPPLPQLNATQLLAADTSGNGSVTSFDAGQIARYVVGNPGSGATGTWRFTPANRTYVSVLSAFTAEDYTALLMGEASGNWSNTGARPAGTVVRGQMLDVSEDGDTAMPITVTVQDVVTAAGKEIVVPVNVEGVTGKEIISYEFNLRYDPSVVQPLANPVNLKDSVSRGLSVVTNTTEPGILRVVMYGPMPIDETGLLLNLRFKAVGDTGSTSVLKWEQIIFNDGEPPITATDGQITIN